MGLTESCLPGASGPVGRRRVNECADNTIPGGVGAVRKVSPVKGLESGRGGGGVLSRVRPL